MKESYFLIKTVHIREDKDTPYRWTFHPLQRCSKDPSYLAEYLRALFYEFVNDMEDYTTYHIENAETVLVVRGTCDCDDVKYYDIRTNIMRKKGRAEFTEEVIDDTFFKKHFRCFPFVSFKYRTEDGLKGEEYWAIVPGDKFYETERQE